MSRLLAGLNEELGISERLSFGFFARYQGDLDRGMKENEFVHVYFGRLRSRPRPDPAEVAKLEFASLSEISKRMRQEPDIYTYWLKHYIRHHLSDIARLANKELAAPLADTARTTTR